MLFPCGWPKSYAAFPENYGHDEIVSCIPQLAASSFAYPTCFLASKRAVQLWSATENPFKLGQMFLPPKELLRMGPQVAAEWSAALSCALCLTSKGWIVLYTIQSTGKKVVNRSGISGPLRDATTVKISVHASVQLYGNSIGNCLVTMGHSVLIGTGDGMLQIYDWMKMNRALQTGEVCEVRDEGNYPVSRRGLVKLCTELPTWFAGCLDLLSLERTPLSAEESNSLSFTGSPDCPPGKISKGAIVDLDYSSRVDRLAVTFEDGSTGLCHTEDAPLMSLHVNQWINEGGESYKVTCARIGDCANMVAVGCTDGSIILFRLTESFGIFGQSSEQTNTPVPSPVRKLDLSDWGHGPDITGPVQDICWSGDCTAFAVGFRQRGIVVWTPSGCRLMCSLPQTPLKPRSSLICTKSTINSRQSEKLSLSGRSTEELRVDVTLHQRSNSVGAVETDIPTLEWGVSVLAWGTDGYRLWVGQTGLAKEVWELKFVRSLSGRHRVSHPSEKNAESSEAALEEVHFLQGDDRLLLISELPTGSAPDSGMDAGLLDARFSESQLTVRHVRTPQEYIAENWPIRLAAVSTDGSDVAMAGSHGLVIYSRRTQKWRLFGDVSQEKSISALLLNWLDRIIVVCSMKENSRSDLLLFPHYHLDFASLLLRHELPYAPVALDCLDHYVLIASEPLNIVLFRCTVKGELTRSSRSTASLTALRELSILSLERPLFNVSLTKTSDDPSKVPDQCVVLRWGGVMTLLDMEKGVEQFLASEVECFWLSDAAKVPANPSTAASYIVPTFSLDSTELPSVGRRRRTVNMVEMPWWAYGVRGMELWFPSSLTEPLSPRRLCGRGHAVIGQLDPELEFDREVYPIGISLADAAIIGVSQRLVRPPAALPDVSPSLSLPCFSPMPDTQPVLPCLLRRLLQRGAVQEAKLLARKHQKVGLHFSKSLEWLLFTALEFQASTNSENRASLSSPKAEQSEPSLLSLATGLVKDFPQYPDVVVSVARKTDAQLWPLLFDVVGRPSEILDILLNQGASHSAACLLLVIDKMEGGVLARALSLQVLQVALSGGEYDLVAELLRYAVTQSDFDRIFTKGNSESVPPSEPAESGPASWFSWLWGGQAEKGHDSPPRSSGQPVLSGASFEAAKMVREHVWCLLEFSQIQSLLALAHSVSSLGGGLPALMGYCTEQEAMNETVTMQSIRSAMITVHAQLAVEHLHSDAELLLEVCQHARCDTWSFVLALLLQHMPVIVSFRLRRSQLWEEIYKSFSTESAFVPYFDVMKEFETGNSTPL